MCVCVHTFKHKYLPQPVGNQILAEASLERGKGCITFLVRSDHNSGFYGNRYFLYGYKGENLVTTLAPSF